MAEGDETSIDEVVTYRSENRQGAPDLRFIHYNDVYHVEAGSREPVGGIARFKTLCRYYQGDARFEGQPDALTFFSGDAFNPSLESSITKGQHMVPVLNSIGTSVACLGNHDLDFGVEQFQYLAAQCTFPWLCANVLDPALGEDVPLANCKRTVILTSSNGIKIGVIGLVEREWLDTINSLPPNLQYRSASATAAELAPQLRTNGAEIVVVVSHQREPNDNKLANKLAPGTVDIILGGHDHFYGHSIINGTPILRSGTDFKQLSYVEARRKQDSSNGWDFDMIRRNIISGIAEDAEAAAMVDKITASMASKLEKPIGYTAAPLDARFTTVRLRESNLGNFVCDLMRFHYFADAAIMAAGTVRGDQIYPPGIVRVKDLMTCFPFEDPCVVIRLRGKDLVAALENAVGKYPALEGRFPQVSGIRFTFDPSKPEGKRCSNVYVGGAPVESEREYKTVTRQYMTQGKDGFTSMMLKEDGGPAESIVSEENGMLLSAILRQYFMSLKVIGKWQHWNQNLSKHWDAVHSNLHDVHPVQDPATKPGETVNGVHGSVNGHTESGPARKKPRSDAYSNGEVDPTESEDDADYIHLLPIKRSESDRELFLKRKFSRKWWRQAKLPGHPNLCETAGDDEGVPWARGIAPRVEGRIRMVGDDGRSIE